MSTRNLTPAEYERERIATEHEQSLRRVLPPLDVDAAIDEIEFYTVFGRRPDAYDRKLGLARVVEVAKDLRQLHGRKPA